VPDEVADHGPYDVSIELVGGAGVAAALPLMANGGRIVVMGSRQRAKVELNLLTIMGSRTTSGLHHAVTCGGGEGGGGPGRRGACRPAAGRGRVTVPVAARVPMARRPGYDLFASGGKFGKIVLVND